MQDCCWRKLIWSASRGSPRPLRQTSANFSRLRRTESQTLTVFLDVVFTKTSLRFRERAKRNRHRSEICDGIGLIAIVSYLGCIVQVKTQPRHDHCLVHELRSTPLGLKAWRDFISIATCSQSQSTLVLESHLLTLNSANHDTGCIFWNDLVVV